MTLGSCSNSFVQLQKDDKEHLRCKLSRLKRAGELDETGSDWMLLVLCDNGFVFKQLCSAPEGGHRTAAVQTEQAEKSRRTALGAMTMGSCLNSSVQLQQEDIERLRCKLSRLKRAGEPYETGFDWMLLVL